MKTITIIISLLCFTSLNAQETIKVYFDGAQKHLKSEHHFSVQSTEKMYHGDFVEYYESGKPKIKGGYALGQLHGDYSEFNEDKSLKLKCRYTNGILNGEHKTFYPSGNVKERKLFINGKIQGDRKFYPDKKGAAPDKIEKYQMGKKL
jgi:antitoxin component YwqK of YwqJK toxin-antitoxin module